MTSLLPDDIIAEILLRLPMRSLPRFRCVCKTWCNLLSNNGVEKEKLKVVLTGRRHYGGYNSVDYYDSSLACYDVVGINNYTDKCGRMQIVGACNGLLCCHWRDNRNDDSYFIWNASTKEYKVILKPVDDESTSNIFFQTFYDYGFGYDCNTEDYKFVRITINYNDDHVCLGCKVHVYTLGSNSWKSIPVTFPYSLRYEGVLYNGALHWIAKSLTGVSKDSEVIVSFDIRHERFTELPPAVNWDKGMSRRYLGALGGYLCILRQCIGVGVEVWGMKDYGVRDSWTKLFVIAEQSFLTIPRSLYFLKRIQSFKNGEILIYVQKLASDSLFVLYNPKHESVTTMTVNCGGGFKTDAAVYVENLVSLNTGTYMGQRTI